MGNTLCFLGVSRGWVRNPLSRLVLFVALFLPSKGGTSRLRLRDTPSTYCSGLWSAALRGLEILVQAAVLVLFAAAARTRIVSPNLLPRTAVARCRTLPLGPWPISMHFASHRLTLKLHEKMRCETSCARTFVRQTYRMLRLLLDKGSRRARRQTILSRSLTAVRWAPTDRPPLDEHASELKHHVEPICCFLASIDLLGRL